MGFNHFWGSAAYQHECDRVGLYALIKHYRPNLSRRPIVGIDVRIGYNIIISGSRDFLFAHARAMALKVFKLYEHWIHNGFDIIFIDDNSNPLPSKLASFQRRFSKDANRRKIPLVLEDLRTAGPDNIEEARKAASKVLKAACSVGPELINEFKQILTHMFPERVSYFEAACQADSQLAYMLTCGNIDVIDSPDGDILAVYGARWTVKSFDGSRYLIGSIHSFEKPLPLKTTKKPDFKLFSKKDSPRTRTTIGVILGSDNMPGGVKGFGPARLSNLLYNTNRNVDEILSQFDPIVRDMVEAAVQSHLAEYVYSDTTSPDLRYFNMERPLALLRYNAHFVLPDGPPIQIIDQDLWMCAGISSGFPHELLSYAVKHSCNTCQRTFCGLCVGKTTLRSAPTVMKCLDCDTEPGSNNIDNVTPSNINTGAELIPLLTLLNDSNSVTVSPFANNINIDVANISTLRAYIQSLNIQIHQDPESLNEERLRDICRALHSGEMTSNLIPTQEEQTARAVEAVEAGILRREEVYWAFPIPAPEASDTKPFTEDFLHELPIEQLMFLVDIVINIQTQDYLNKSAIKGRPSGTENLMRQALRDAIAGWTFPLSHHQAYISGQNWLYLNGRIHPSYKSTPYSSQIWLGSQSFLFSSCTCPAGSVLCQHSLCLLTQLCLTVMLPKDGLVDILLDCLTFESAESVEDYLPKIRNMLCQHHKREFSEGELLDLLVPGTEKKKLFDIPMSTAAKQLKITPIRELSFKSPSHCLKNLKDGQPKSRKPSKKTFDTYDPTAGISWNPTPDYALIYEALNQANMGSDSRGAPVSETIGYYLIKYRADPTNTDSTTSELVERPPPRRSKRLNPELDPPSTSSSSTSSSTSSTSSSEQPSYNRQKCAMVNCPCTGNTCPGVGHWTRCPSQSVAKDSAQRRKADHKRRRWFINIGRPYDHTQRPIVCGCHAKDIDNVPLPSGSLYDNESSRSDPRNNSFRRQSQPTNPELSQIHDLFLQNELLRTELKDLQLENEQLRKTLSEQEQTQVVAPEKWQILLDSDEKTWELIKFSSVSHFLAYLDLLTNCRRDILAQLQDFRYDRIQDDLSYKNRIKFKGKYSHASVSWLDQAVIYFARKNGKKKSALALDFEISSKTLRLILIKWTIFESKRRRAIGEHLSYGEYCALIPEDWRLRCPDRRVIMWDTTDFRLAGKPSEAGLQAATANAYYGGNVLKAGIGNAPSGWLTGGMLFPGRISDTKYIITAGILKTQQEIQTKDGGPPFTNISDKGFRIKDTAFLDYGKQESITPSYRRRGTSQFTVYESVQTTNVARLRAENERMVRRPCSFGFVRNRVSLSENLYLVDDMWLNICFQCNFIFRPLNATLLGQLQAENDESS